MHTFSVPLLLPLLSLEKAEGEPRPWQVISSLLRWWNKQCWKSFLGMWRTSNSWRVLSGSTDDSNTVCLNLSPQQLQGLGYKNRWAKKPHQPSNQHQTSFLLFKLDLAPKSCWGDCLFLKAQPDQCSTSKRTASCLSTESAWSRSLACYKTEPGSWLMPKEQQLEYLLH